MAFIVKRDASPPNIPWKIAIFGGGSIEGDLPYLINQSN